MSLAYETAIDRMYALGHELSQTLSQKFDLAHIRTLLGALGSPEKRYPSVLIAGTNGKGSTAATLASILHAAGLKTALYTSPHLLRLNERIRINGEQIGDDDFARLHAKVDDTAERLVNDGSLPWHPSFFEMLTAIGFQYFADHNIDIAVLEVGMGGRLDATNVVAPRLAVITDISLDHQKYLGDTVTEIAREKAGIIRRHGIVITLPQQPEANDVIGNVSIELNARAISAVPFVPPVSPASENVLARNDKGHIVSRYRLLVLGEEILIETPLIGRHQLRNVALAIAAAEELHRQGFAITPTAVAEGVRNTRWPGRLQVIPAKADAPEYLLDVAHNPAGAWALRSALSALYEDRKITFVFGAMRDKAIREIAEILFPLAERVITTPINNPRSATAEEIREAATRISVEIEAAADTTAALQRAQATTPRDGIIVVTGSVYLVGEAMQALSLRIA